MWDLFDPLDVGMMEEKTPDPNFFDSKPTNYQKLAVDTLADDDSDMPALIDSDDSDDDLPELEEVDYN